MKNIIYIILGGLLIAGCAKEKGESQVDNQSQNSNSNTISLTAQQIETINLEIGHMEERSLSRIIKANGYLDVPPQNRAVISPMITGYVRKINFLVGDDVKKGQIMAELESMEFIDMQQKYIELKSQLVFLEDDYHRQKLLRDQDAVSRKKYLMAEVEYNTAVTTLNGIQSKLVMLGLNTDKLMQGEIQPRFTLKALISGSVNKLEVAIGQHVNPSEEIYKIVNIDHLHLELDVFEKDVTKVKKGQKVRFQVSGIEKQEFTGKIFLVGNDLSEDKRSINVHVHLDDEESAITVGMYANASISVGETVSFTLPVTSVVIENEREFVFKRVKGSGDELVFEKIPVKTGMESEGLVEIINSEDLSEEDEIVTEGAFYLLNAFSGGEN